MYVGHLAVALSAVRARPRVPLVFLLIATQIPDWVEVVLKTVGQADPGEVYSHSLPVVFATGLIIAVAYVVVSADWVGGALLVAVCLSHPLLDLITGTKVIWPGASPKGGCLYSRPALDFVVEALAAYAGWVVYRGGVDWSRARRPTIAILVTLVICQLALDSAQQFRIIIHPDRGRACADPGN